MALQLLLHHGGSVEGLCECGCILVEFGRGGTLGHSRVAFRQNEQYVQVLGVWLTAGSSPSLGNPHNADGELLASPCTHPHYTFWL